MLRTLKVFEVVWFANGKVRVSAGGKCYVVNLFDDFDEIITKK
jgi:hypothetical protein